jgi:HlyD family secretion protein
MARVLGLLLLLFSSASCTGQLAAAPTPSPTPVATSIPVISSLAGGTARASGKVAPASHVKLSLAVAGRIEQLLVAVGDSVEAGALLVVLDDTSAQATVAQAQAALLRAQAYLQELQAGPRPQEIAAAQARLDAAQAHLDQLTEAARAEELAAAQAELDAAQARFDTLYTEPDAAVVATAWAQLQRARAAFERLLHPATASQIAEATAQVQNAQAGLELLVAGARPEAVAAAAAAVAEAEATLQRAHAELAASRLHAPFAGMVTALNARTGERVQAGEVVLVLADLQQLQVETTDLSERDVVRLAVGQPVTLYLKALGTEATGTVARIAPQATIIGGDVVYSVVIDLDEPPPDLRWGMSVDVEIIVE